MAKYNVTDYSLEIRPNDAGASNLYLTANLVNSSGNPKHIAYRMWADERFDDLGAIYSFLNDAFKAARDGASKIELEDYAERYYLFAGPAGSTQQFSAAKL